MSEHGSGHNLKVYAIQLFQSVQMNGAHNSLLLCHLTDTSPTPTQTVRYTHTRKHTHTHTTHLYDPARPLFFNTLLCLLLYCHLFHAVEDGQQLVTVGLQLHTGRGLATANHFVTGRRLVHV
jgi:hypothetical protein